MGFENLPERFLVVRGQKEFIEITPTKYNDCDHQDVFSLQQFFSSILYQIDFPLDISKISVLDLSHCNLEDLPESCNILNLSQLVLAHNKLKTIPSCLHSNFEHLDLLDLSHNAISSFDIAPHCVENLKKLKINNNGLKSLPKWILTFQALNLEELTFSNNPAAHYGYLKGFNMSNSKLKKLKLRNCRLIDDDFGFLKCIKPLQYLDISNTAEKRTNRFHEVDELFVKPKWEDLKVLKMNNISLPMFPDGVAWIESLVELHLANNSMSWLPDGIEYMSNLELLDVSNNYLVAIPEKVTKVETLKVIQASFNSIGYVPNMSSMPSLIVLDLYHNYLQDMSFGLDTVSLIDLELNCLDTKLIDSATEYENKKNRYRALHSLDRANGPKQPQTESDASSEEPKYGGLDEYSDDGLEPSRFASFDSSTGKVDADEDWSSPVKLKDRNPDIDSDDENYTGEDCKWAEFITREKVYVEDEDWMFVDADEIL